MKPIISIIIPVYNVEEYLRKCLDSCINQTFNDIEVIVVNDCSPDNSDKIMKEYEKKYPDIIKCLYLTKNLRQGGARNKGLEIAEGEYILFVDSDDYVANDMCEKLYKSACSNDADVVICDYFRVVNNTCVKKSQFDIDVKGMKDLSKNILFDYRIKPGICCKLFRKKLILCKKFPENVYYEDLSVTMVWLLSAKKINYIKDPLYYYSYRENSVICEKNYFTTLQYANALIRLIENFKNANMYEKYYKYICVHILKKVCDFLCNYIIGFLECGSRDIIFLSQYVNENIEDWEVVIENEEKFMQYEKNILYNFLSDSNYLENLYLNSQKKLNKLFNQNKVAIWGAGLYGKNILKFLEKFEISPLYIIDSNTNLYGSYIKNVLVTSLERVYNNCDIIIISVKDRVSFNEIKLKIRSINENIKIMDYAEIFEFN